MIGTQTMPVENKRLLGVTGYISRRWYLIDAFIMLAFVHGVRLATKGFNLPIVFLYALIPFTIFFVYGLAFRRSKDVLGDKSPRWLPVAVAIAISLPVANLILSGALMFVPGKLSHQTAKTSSWRFTLEQMIALALAIGLSALVLVYKPSAFREHRVEEMENANSSMEPTLPAGNMVSVQKDFDRALLKRGDIVLVDSFGHVSLKRIIAVAGDNVRFQGHTIWINGIELSQSVPPNSAEILEKLSAKDSDPKEFKSTYEIKKETVGTSEYLIIQGKENLAEEVVNGELKIGPGKIWVVGDNRENSVDSRINGTLPLENVIGIVHPK
jgi:signal peptidase I